MVRSGAQYGTGSLNLIGEQLLRFVCCFGPSSSVTVRSACSKDDKSSPSIFFSPRKAECESANANCSFKICAFPGVLCHHLGAPWWLYTSTEGEWREQCADKQIHTSACRHTPALLTYHLLIASVIRFFFSKTQLRILPPMTLFFFSIFVSISVFNPTLSWNCRMHHVISLSFTYSALWLRLLRLVTVPPLSPSVRSSASQQDRIIEWIRPHGVQCTTCRSVSVLS